MKKIISILLFVLPIYVFAQPLPSIEEKTKGLKKVEGFLPYYLDLQNVLKYLKNNIILIILLILANKI
jgi:hypothetical protein